jgi:hypothetical protein
MTRSAKRSSWTPWQGAIDALENRRKRALLGPRFKVPLMLNEEEAEEYATHKTQAVACSA